MLDRSKLLSELANISDSLFVGFADELEILASVWQKVVSDQSFQEKVTSKKHSFLVPKWQDSLEKIHDVVAQASNYAVLAVDGSQIYYDKHQGPACYLINVGYVQLRYGLPGKSVDVGSFPQIFMKESGKIDFGSTDFVNMQREGYEFEAMLQQIEGMEKEIDIEKTVCLFDGSLIFFHLDPKDMEVKQQFLEQYCKALDVLSQKKILTVGYMSFPKTRELINLCRLEMAQFDDVMLEQISVFERLSDVDILGLFLQQGQRTIMFQSCAPIAFLYPEHLKPYFCYMNIGKEIVRLEFPAWIASDEPLVQQVCSVVYDQALKGSGYPVCLFEAHEQAVVKAADREFFYALLRQMGAKKMYQYQISQKSYKKHFPTI